jgi:hypothetical protein
MYILILSLQATETFRLVLNKYGLKLLLSLNIPSELQELHSKSRK